MSIKSDERESKTILHHADLTPLFFHLSLNFLSCFSNFTDLDIGVSFTEKILISNLFCRNQKKMNQWFRHFIKFMGISVSDIFFFYTYYFSFVTREFDTAGSLVQSSPTENFIFTGHLNGNPRLPGPFLISRWNLLRHVPSNGWSGLVNLCEGYDPLPVAIRIKV